MEGGGGEGEAGGECCSLCPKSVGSFPPDAESLAEQPVVPVGTGHGVPLPLLVTGCCLLPPHEPGPPQKLLLCLQDSLRQGGRKRSRRADQRLKESMTSKGNAPRAAARELRQHQCPDPPRLSSPRQEPGRVGWSWGNFLKSSPGPVLKTDPPPKNPHKESYTPFSRPSGFLDGETSSAAR